MHRIIPQSVNRIGMGPTPVRIVAGFLISPLQALSTLYGATPHSPSACQSLGHIVWDIIAPHYEACQGHTQIRSIAKRIGCTPIPGAQMTFANRVPGLAQTCPPHRFIYEINSDDNSPLHFDQPLLTC